VPDYGRGNGRKQIREPTIFPHTRCKLCWGFVAAKIREPCVMTGNWKRQIPARVSETRNSGGRANYGMVDLLRTTVQFSLKPKVIFPKVMPQTGKVAPPCRLELRCEVPRAEGGRFKMRFKPVPFRRAYALSRVSVIDR
jgi:hypothetical protein